MDAFRDFKKTMSDKKSTTFEHPNGSKLIVSHAKLDPQTLKRISEIPIAKACGGSVQKFSGKEGDPTSSEVQPQNPQDDPVLLKRMEQIKGIGKGIKDVMFGSDEDHAKLNPQFQAPASQGAPAPAAAEPAPTNVNLGAPQAPAPGGVNPPQAPGGNFKYDPYQGLNTQMAGNDAEADAIGNLETQKAQIFKNYNDTLGQITSQAQQNAFNNKVETDNVIDDMKAGHIDPKAYMNNMGAGQKVSTAIGLLLGGMGGGVLHTGGNVAMDFLNKQIDRDVAAQQSNLDNKKTIFNAMQSQYGNQQDALKMTHAFYLAKMGNEINEAAAKSGSPLALARAQQLNGPIQQQLQQLHYEVGMRQSAMNALGSGGDATAAIPFLVSNPAEQQKAVEAYGKIKELNKLHQNMRESAEQLRQKTMNGAFSPNDTASAKQAFAGAVQKLSEGRYNEDAANKIVTSLLPQMGDMGSTGQNKDKRMDEFFDAFRQEPTAVLNSHFIPAPQMPPRFKKRK